MGLKQFFIRNFTASDGVQWLCQHVIPTVMKQQDGLGEIFLSTLEEKATCNIYIHDF